MDGCRAGAAPDREGAQLLPPAPVRVRRLRMLAAPGAAIVALVALASLLTLWMCERGTHALVLFGLDAPTSVWLLVWSVAQLFQSFGKSRSAAFCGALLVVCGSMSLTGVLGPLSYELSLVALSSGLLVAAIACDARPAAWGAMQVSMFAAVASIVPLVGLRLWQQPVPLFDCAGCGPTSGLVPGLALVGGGLIQSFVFVRHAPIRPERSALGSGLLMASHVLGWATVILLASGAADGADDEIWFGLAGVAALFASCALYFAMESRSRAGELARTIAKLEREAEARCASEARERERERLIHRTLDHAAFGFWVWDLASGRVTLSQGAAEQLGLSAEMRFTSIATIRSMFHPEDGDRSFRAALALTYGRGDVGSFEFRIVRPNGELRWLRARLVIWRDDGGRALRASCVSNDTTEERAYEEALQESEERFRRALDAAPFPVLLHVSDGSILLVNEAFTRQSGWAEDELRNVRDWLERAIGETLESEIGGAMRRVFESANPLHAGPFEVTNRAGATRLWQLDFVPLGALPDGRRLAMTAATDVTARDLASELARSNYDLEQFAYIASHDLQEPLRMVASFMQLLESRYKGRLDDEADRFIHFAVDGAHRMQSLLNDLLTYSRAGRGDVPDAMVDLEDVLRDVTENLHRRIEECAAVISFDAMPALRGLRSHFVLILQNLVANALKYRREDEAPQIHVGFVEKGEERLLFVRDNGIGFDPAQAERIFRPFQRLHEVHRYPGSGIGLAIVRRIVARYGGKVWAESEPGAGSTFWLALPFVAAELEKPASE